MTGNLTGGDLDLSGGGHGGHGGGGEHEEEEVIMEHHHHHPTLFQSSDHHYKDSLCNNKAGTTPMVELLPTILISLGTYFVKVPCKIGNSNYSILKALSKLCLSQFFHF